MAVEVRPFRVNLTISIPDPVSARSNAIASIDGKPVFKVDGPAQSDLIPTMA